MRSRVLVLFIAFVGAVQSSACSSDSEEGAACSGCTDAGTGGASGSSQGNGGGWPGGNAGAAGAAGGEPIDPGPPDFPDVIDRLTITVRTDTVTNAGTDDNDISVCLTESLCFPLAVAGADDFESGDFGVYHFDGVDLPRSSVERVEIRSQNGTDAWRPACLEIQFDGEPVHCEDDIGVWIGTDATDTSSFIDPNGVHNACTTCYPSTLSHGPVLGATTSQSARLWMRTDATRQVVLSLLDAPQSGSSKIVGYAYPLPENDYTSVFDVGGLEPATAYAYTISVEGAEVEAGTFETAPAPGAAGQVRFAVGSCAQQVARPEKGLGDGRPIFKAVLESDPDVFLFVGDNIYPDFIQSAPDLATLRYHYRRASSIPEQHAVTRGVPTFAIWDDHDYAGNNTSASAPNKQHGYKAFQEFWANPAYGTAETPGVFHRFSWGDVDVFMLDVRYYRSPDPKGTFDDAGTVIGDAQMQWLKAELSASQATFKLIASGTLFSYTGTGDGSESWAEYPSARDELFDYIVDQKIEGVVLLSGDIHRSTFRKILRQAAGGYDLPELVSSPLRNTAGACPTAYSDSEQVACVGGVELFMTVDIDTLAPDPTLIATLIDGAGAERASWKILRSTLQ